MQNEYLTGIKKADPMRVNDAIKQTLSIDPHLTDSELIEFCSDVVEQEALERFKGHLKHCSRCTSEASGLNAIMTVWSSPTEIERLETRIGRPGVMSGEGSPLSWARNLSWSPLAALRQSLGAYALAIDSEVIAFNIYDNHQIASGLSGSIHRRGQEYQIRITPSTEDRQEYLDRLVEVVLADTDTEDVLLHRRIPIDRFVLLGTDLHITTEKIAARLIT